MSAARIPRTSHEAWMANLRDDRHERLMSRFPNDLATDQEGPLVPSAPSDHSVPSVIPSTLPLP